MKSFSLVCGWHEDWLYLNKWTKPFKQISVWQTFDLAMKWQNTNIIRHTESIKWLQSHCWLRYFLDDDLYRQISLRHRFQLPSKAQPTDRDASWTATSRLVIKMPLILVMIESWNERFFTHPIDRNDTVCFIYNYRRYLANCVPVQVQVPIWGRAKCRQLQSE